MTDCGIEIEGQELLLLPERGAFWVEAGTLLVADTHWGKAAAFRSGGIPVPGGTTSGALSRISHALDRTAAHRVVFLGDFLHAKAGRAPRTLSTLAEWRASYASIEMVLVRGNHDRHAGDPPSELGIHCVDAPLHEPPFVLQHHPGESPSGYVLAGHLHPAVSLVGRGRQRQRLPCFWFGVRHGILPAFGDFTGTVSVEPDPQDLVFVLTDGAVVKVS